MLFVNKINTSVLDRIIITDKDVEKIVKVVNEIHSDPILKDKIMEAEMPFDTKGIVVYKLTNPKISKVINNASAQFYFNLANPKGLEINEIDDDGTLLYRVILDTTQEHYDIKVFQKSRIMKESDMIAMAKRVAMILLDFMKYTQYVGYMKQNNPIVIKRAVVRKNSKSDTKKPAKDSRAVVSVSKPKLIYDYEEAEREGEKRSYERQAESWEVAGHWRTYKKSGKRVFVKGYKKGEGIKKGKDYKI